MALNLEETIPIINKIYLDKKHFHEVFFYQNSKIYVLQFKSKIIITLVIHSYIIIQ